MATRSAGTDNPGGRWDHSASSYKISRLTCSAEGHLHFYFSL